MPSSLRLQRMNPPSTVSVATIADGQDVKYVKMGHGENVKVNPIISLQTSVPDTAKHFHKHLVGSNQGCSAIVQTISAPVETVWSVVRQFDKPQAYKHFLKSCHVIVGDGKVGTLREVQVISGLPAATSTERLEILDDEKHVISFKVVGGEHRLNNYRSVTSLHATADGKGTVVVESYAVDIPNGNTKEETCVFADTIVRCNLQSLARIAENLAKKLKVKIEKSNLMKV